MPYELELTESEEVFANLTFCPSSNSEALHIAVSNRAIYLPRKKFFAKVDPTYFERVPRHEILGARIKKVQPFWMLLLAVLMIASGFVLTAIMVLPYFQGTKGTGFTGYPPAILVCGLVIPFIIRNRYRLEIECVKNGFQWNPPLLLDKGSRSNTQNFFNLVLEACSQAGIRTIDERTPQAQASAEGSPSGEGFPLATLPSEGAGGVICNCTACGEPIRISRWDKWNNFLVQCPHCHCAHGGHWKLYWYLLAGLFLNSFSFFLTMRPRRALPWAAGFTAFWAVLFYTENRWQYSDLLQFSLYTVAVTGPAGINAVLAIRHEIALGRALIYSS